MQTGRIVRLDFARGYCIIDPDIGTAKAIAHVRGFLHPRDFQRDIVGRRVQFEADEGERGLLATSIRLLAKTEHAAACSGGQAGR
jgi:cold shock CspA family protein